MTECSTPLHVLFLLPPSPTPSLSICTSFNGSPLEPHSPKLIILSNAVAGLSQVLFVFLSGAGEGGGSPREAKRGGGGERVMEGGRKGGREAGGAHCTHMKVEGLGSGYREAALKGGSAPLHSLLSGVPMTPGFSGDLTPPTCLCVCLPAFLPACLPSALPAVFARIGRPAESIRSARFAVICDQAVQGHSDEAVQR